MYTKNIFIVFVPLFLLFACKKVDTNVEESKMNGIIKEIQAASSSLTSEDSLENYILLIFNKKYNPASYINSPQFDNAVNIGATFRDLSQNLSNVGNLYINNNPLAPKSNNAYEYSSITSPGSSSTARLNGVDLTNLYGQDVDVKIDGNSIFDSFTQRVRVPLDFNLTANIPYGSAYISGSDLTLSWTADPSNQFGKVHIQVYYNSTLSKLDSPSSPNTISSLIYLVPDNGSYTIPASALSAFPVGTYFSFSIARANQYEVTMTNSDKKVYIYPVVEVSSKPLKVSYKPTTYVKLARTQDYYYSDPYYTMESTDYYVRYFSNAACTVPLTLINDLPVNYRLDTHQWDYSYGFDDFQTLNGDFPCEANTQEYEVGYTELKNFNNGYYITNTYTLLGGANYTIIN